MTTQQKAYNLFTRVLMSCHICLFDWSPGIHHMFTLMLYKYVFHRQGLLSKESLPLAQLPSADNSTNLDS